MDRRLLTISKSVSYFLRHKPEELEIGLDQEGWTTLDEFIQKLRLKLKDNTITLDTLYSILLTSDKLRFEIDKDENRIRARYGHSVERVDIKYERLTDPIPLYHGTPAVNKEKILREGLIPMKRKYVHLTSDKDLAHRVGQRRSNEVVLFELDTAGFLKDGHTVFKASDVIYLTESVPGTYLKALVR